MHWGKEWIILASSCIASTHIYIIVVIKILLPWRFWFLYLNAFLLILLTWTEVIVILHIWTHHVVLLLLLCFLIHIHELAWAFHHVLLTWVWGSLLLVVILLLEVLVASSLLLIKWGVVTCIRLSHNSSLTILSAVKHFRGKNHFIMFLDLAVWFVGVTSTINAWRFISVLRILLSKIAKPIMIYGLFRSHSLIRVHLKKPLHQINFFVVHNWSVSCFNGLWMSYFWKLKTLISCVSAEFLLKKIGKWAQNFLNYEKLINFGITWK